MTSTARPDAHSRAQNMPVTRTAPCAGVAMLTLSRPQARNTLSEAMIAALADHLADIAGERDVRAVVLAADGPVFCAGHDLKEMTTRRRDSDGGRAYFTRVFETCGALMQAIVALPQPVIAAVHGMATAAGCQLVASCDLAVAANGARFCTPGVDIGLFCSTPMVALTRNVAPKHALEMLFTGEPIAAAEALRIGLVNHVVADGEVRDAALALARRIAGKSTAVVRLGKETFRRQAGLPLADAYALAAQAMVANMLDADAVEGIAAFLEKRPPHWTDR
jgi:enoyl-CoA hydratase/carnithine racemase